MASTKQCINGHYYDSNIYGDVCPFCPKGTGTLINGGETVIGGDDGRTSIENSDNSATIPFAHQSLSQTGPVGGTVIRTVGTSGETVSTRKLVGFLVTYDLLASGKSFNIYEGKNLVGSDSICDITITNDKSISGRHLTILFRASSFLFKDELSTNGTFINGEMKDEGALTDKDVIIIGATKFVFMAIPQSV